MSNAAAWRRRPIPSHRAHPNRLAISCSIGRAADEQDVDVLVEFAATAGKR